MTQFLYKILSPWIPALRYGRWHCNILELLVALFLFFTLPSFVYHILYGNVSDETNTAVTNQDEQDNQDEQSEDADSKSVLKSQNNEHSLMRLLSQKDNQSLFLAFYIACILAPLNEELLFRAGIQNCLQGFLTRICWKVPVLHRARYMIIPLLSIVLVAVFFALIHIPSYSASEKTVEQTIQESNAWSIGSTAFFVICLTYIFAVKRLRFRDFFGPSSQILTNLMHGIVWIIIIIPTYALAILIQTVTLMYDIDFPLAPVALLPLSLVFGFLYYRTQSIIPTMALHCCFNGFSVALAWFAFHLDKISL